MEDVTEETEEMGSAQGEKDYPVNTGETDSRGRELWLTKCDECGKETKVPFKPSPGRDVFCKECYMKRR